MSNYLTPYRKELVARNKKIISEYERMCKVDGAMKTSIVEMLAAKYGLRERASVYKIIRDSKAMQSNDNNN